MNRATFAIVILALLGHLDIAEMVDNTMEPKHLSRLYRTAVDISTKCYSDPGNAVGIIGDTDGSILKAFRSKHMIPVVLVNGFYRIRHRNDNARSHKLQVFVIAVYSSTTLNKLLFEVRQSIWWNSEANFLIVDSRPRLEDQCSLPDLFMITAFRNSILNVQFICHTRVIRSNEVLIFNSNPFMNRAPKVWSFVGRYNLQLSDGRRDGFLFARLYQKGGQSCESINFPKTRNVGGYPLRFMADRNASFYRRDRVFSQTFEDTLGAYENMIEQWGYNEHRLLIDTIVIAMNVSEVISKNIKRDGIILPPCYLSSCLEFIRRHGFGMIMRMTETPIFAVTQHTPHMTQLDKVLTVIDEKSRIGMWLVYLITFLFFKLFLRQPVIPALLNIVRLTCGTGLTRLPQNVAPTIFLACLFMFVVTLQGIYTGNLSTLLTTTIPYPNVQVREDIPKRGYKLHINKNDYAKLIADPILAGHFIEIPRSTNCIKYVLRDPSAVCALDYQEAIMEAAKWKLHVSRDPILHDYPINAIFEPNLLKQRIDEVMLTSFETGLHRSDTALERIRLKFVDDDEVKKNTDRRVMTLDDLRFAFVILGVGLFCSLICFVGEIVIWKIRSKHAKLRDRISVRSSWGKTAKKFRSFIPSLNCRFNVRRLFSNRR